MSLQAPAPTTTAASGSSRRARCGARPAAHLLTAASCPQAHTLMHILERRRQAQAAVAEQEDKIAELTALQTSLRRRLAMMEAGEEEAEEEEKEEEEEEEKEEGEDVDYEHAEAPAAGDEEIEMQVPQPFPPPPVSTEH
eukprot:scaffold25496_cov130-Isochrysis_galbana.AAC.7